MYQFSSALIHGKLLKRYKRFLADVELESGEIITAHCPNTGAMTGCDNQGSKVMLSISNNPKRKYAYTWEYSSDSQGNLIGINTANANRIVKQALLNRRIPKLTHYGNVYSEVKHGDSRIDFMLQEDGAPDAYVEVKSVTLAEGRVALFPDTVTTRGRKHCEELAKIAETDGDAFLFFCVQRENIEAFKIAEKIDPLYAQALKNAVESGVKIMAYSCDMNELGIEISEQLSILS